MNKKTTEESEVHLSIEEAMKIGKTAKEFILIHKIFPRNAETNQGIKMG
ncbi:MAG: hypothetical protein QHH12_03465 [Candidatus Bathyarchaeota archaeon]|nr:hypothetical protein [Candidatus Bathyarchaeota archaeon A05DMB-3]MDH7606815.1 hypothetical protein [Candidatus Bathyarchaeota archaeon]